MTRDEIEKLILSYDALCERAAELTSLYNPEYMKLRMDDDGVIAVSVKSESGYYDSHYLETEEQKVGLEWMTPSDAEFAVMLKQKKADERARRQREAQERAERDAQYREAQERATYEALRKKYGNKAF